MSLATNNLGGIGLSERKFNGTHMPCLSNNCKNYAQHKSGYCPDCRKYTCKACGTLVTPNDYMRLKPKFCQPCSTIKNKSKD